MKYKVEALFCDDVRREDNGKHIIIGVYSNDLRAVLPASIQLATWVRVFGLEVGEHRLQFEVFANGKRSAELEAHGVVRADGAVISLALPALPILLGGSGKLELKLGVDGAAPEVVSEIPVISVETPPVANAEN